MTSRSPSCSLSMVTSSPSSSSPDIVSVISTNKNRKACDSCKLRKVRCLVLSKGDFECAQCKKHGLACTTTPHIRKKAVNVGGRRVELARATFGSHQSNTRSTPSNPCIRLSPSDADSRLGILELSGTLATHLLELHSEFPHNWLPIVSHRWLSLLFDRVGRRLDLLPPEAEVMAYTIMALSSTISSHPLLFSPGPTPPSFSSIQNGLLDNLDLQIYGKRRADACAHLRNRAITLAWQRGTLALGGRQNMECCFLLEKLLERTGVRAGKPYGSAFATHLRELAALGTDGTSAMNMTPLDWRYVLMLEALTSLHLGTTSNFVSTDEILLCVSIPERLEVIAAEARALPDDFEAFIRFLVPYLHHVTSLARLCSDCLTGPASRSRPLDESFVSRYLVLLDDLHCLFNIIDTSLQAQVSFSTRQFNPGEISVSRFVLKYAWAFLTLPPYIDMQQRVCLLDGEDVIIEDAQHQRKKERYCLLLSQTRRTALRGAKMMSECVRDAPSIGFLSHLMPTNFESWAEIVAGSLAHEDEVDGDTRLERVRVLKCLLDVIKWIGWSWPGDAPKINALQQTLQNWQSCLPTDLHLGDIPWYPYGEYFPVDTTPFGFNPPEIPCQDPSIWESI